MRAPMGRPTYAEALEIPLKMTVVIEGSTDGSDKSNMVALFAAVPRSANIPAGRIGLFFRSPEQLDEILKNLGTARISVWGQP